MIPYVILILLAILCAATDVVPVKNRFVITVPFIVLMFMMAAFRDHIGGDYEMYESFYVRIVGIGDYFRGLYHPFYRTKSFEEGFVVFSSLVRSIDFTHGPYFFTFVIAVVTFSIFIPSLKEYTPYVYIAILFYMYKAYFWHDFTLARQALSIAFFTFSIRYVLRKEYWKYILLNLVAFSMHYSAIILLPLCFFLNHKFSIRTILIIMLVAVSLSIVGKSLFSLCIHLADVIGIGNRFANYVMDKGTINPLNFIEIFIILVCALFYRNYYEEKEPYFNIFLNLFIISSFLIIAFSSFEIFARFKEFFVIAYMILISYMIGHVESTRNRWLLLGFLSIYVMLGYFRYIITFGNGNLIPYKWILW